MLKSALPAAALVAAAVFAIPASAQVLGGAVNGSVGGNIGVQTPPVGAAAGTIGGVARGAGELTRDTVRDSQDLVGGALPSGRVEAGVDAGATTSVSAADAGVQASTGAMVHAPSGEMIGRVVSVSRDASGRVQTYVVRTADGSERLLPSGSAAVQGGVIIASEADLQRPSR